MECLHFNNTEQSNFSLSHPSPQWLSCKAWCVSVSEPRNFNQPWHGSKQRISIHWVARAETETRMCNNIWLEVYFHLVKFHPCHVFCSVKRTGGSCFSHFLTQIFTIEHLNYSSKSMFLLSVGFHLIYLYFLSFKKKTVTLYPYWI